MRRPSPSLELPANLDPTAASTRKLGRARHHGNEVLQALDSFGTHAHIRREVDFRQRKGMDYKVVSGIPDPPPPDIALVFGDYIQNLRASLDYLVGEMRRNGPSGKSAFPISRSSKEFTSTRPSKLSGIPAEATTVIEEMQVYDDTDLIQDPTRSLYRPLRWLETLWNIDKHRTIVLTTTAIEFMYATSQARSGESGIGFDFTDDGRVAEIWIPVTEEDAGTNFYAEVRLSKPSGYAADWPIGLDQIGLDGVVAEIFRTVVWRVIRPLGRFIR
jgi:hypothetical protein